MNLMKTSDTISQIAEALLNAQGRMEGVVRDSENPFHKNRYASLEAVIATVKPVLQAQDLCFVQFPGRVENDCITVTTRIMHISGEWIESDAQIPLTKKDAQGAGSAITYLCRYSLMAALGVPPVDDDGESAVLRTHEPVKKAAPAPAPAKQEPSSDDVAKNFYRVAAKTAIDLQKTTADLKEWWKSETENRRKNNIVPGDPIYADIKAHFDATGIKLAAKEKEAKQ